MTYKLAKIIVFPRGEAIKYEKYILKKLRNTIALLNQGLKPFFANNKISEATRVDDYVDDLQTILSDIGNFINVNDYSLIKDLFSFGGSFLKYTRKQLVSSLSGILSVEVASPSIEVNVFNNPLLDKNIDLMLKSWVSTNTNLIKTIQTDLLSQVGVIVESGYRSGLSMTTLSKQLQAKFNISKNRAKLIARDQTAKLHSNYIEHEHKQIGISEYVWKVSEEEGDKDGDRVRKSHRALNNKICQWSNATTYRDEVGGILKNKISIGGVLLQVGIDFQCRCSLVAVVDIRKATAWYQRTKNRIY